MNYIVNQSRMTGINRAVQELGISPDRIIVRTGLNTPSDCTAATDEMLRLGVKHILTLDDGVCLSVLKRLKERFIRIPEQVRVACLYDNQLLEQYEPPISALQFDAAALGQVACRELLRCLRGESFEAAPSLGYRLCLRESTR